MVALLVLPAPLVAMLAPVPAFAATGCVPDSGQDLAGRTVTVGMLERSSLHCADLRGARLDGLQLDDIDLTGADLRGASLVKTSLEQATLDRADFFGAILTGATLSQASVTGAAFAGVHAAGADLSQVDFSGDSLKGADLAGTDLEQSELKHADLRDADLRDASLDQADVTGAMVAGANLAGASTDEVDGLDTVVGAATGGFPIDALVAVLTLLLALIVLLPRTRAKPGRAAAGVLLALVGVAAVAEVVAGVGFRVQSDDLFFLPMITPVVFLAILIGNAIGRLRRGSAAALVAAAGLAGFFALTDSVLAFLAGPDAFSVVTVQSCTGAPCAYGLARGGPGVTVGIVLILTVVILSRARPLRRPRPSLADFMPPVSGWNAPGRASRAGATSGGPNGASSDADGAPSQML